MNSHFITSHLTKSMPEQSTKDKHIFYLLTLKIKKMHQHPFRGQWPIIIVDKPRVQFPCVHSFESGAMNTDHKLLSINVISFLSYNWMLLIINVLYGTNAHCNSRHSWEHENISVTWNHPSCRTLGTSPKTV